MDIKEQVYWQTTTRMPDGDERASLPGKVDVAVIGGGIPGLAAARQLARRGAAVAVLEAEIPGWGASSRNGGMALTGLKLSPDRVEARYGSDLTRQLFADSVAAVASLEQIVRQEAIACDFRRSGHLLLANKPGHFSALQREAEALERHFKHTTRLVPQSMMEAEIGSQVFFGGLVDESSAAVNPAQFVSGLAQAAAKAGAVLCSNARLVGFRKTQPGFQLQTGRGGLEAREVLVTTGGYTGPATPDLQRRILPIGSYIIATQPLPESLARELSPNNRMIFDFKRYLNYFRLSADRRMVFGGRAAFAPESPASTRQSARMLRAEMVHVFPQLKEVEVEYAWGGTLDFALDMMPHAGQRQGITHALGFAGHGVALGAHLGTQLGDALLDGTVNELPYAAYKFPIVPPGRINGRPWFLPLVGAWHKFLDKVQ